MTIIKGEEFTFIVTIIEKGSFLPQDLTDIDLGDSYFKLIELDTLDPVCTGTSTISVDDALNGRLKIVLDSNMTSALSVLRGDAVDNYYLKPVYQGIIHVEFTDTTPTRTAIIEKVYVAPIGGLCV